MIVGDAGFGTLLGALSGMALLYALPIVGQPMIERRFGIQLRLDACRARCGDEMEDRRSADKGRRHQ